MRILLITQYFYPENFRINDVVAGLRKRGHAITVLTGLPNYPEGHVHEGYGWFRRTREILDGVEIVRVPLIARGRGGGLRLALNYLSYAFFATVIGLPRCRGRYDVILVYQMSPITMGIPAIVFRWWRGLHVVFWVQDLWPESLRAAKAVRSPRVLRLINKLVRFIYERCDAILVQSRGFIPAIQAMGVPLERMAYLPNSAEDCYRPVDPAECAGELAELPAGFRAVYAGNIGAAQDFPTLLAAAERTRHIPDLHWVIFGDGRMRSWVEGQVRARGLSATVHLLGTRPVTLMPRYFALADLLLVTLRRDPIFALTIPSKVQSYLACGRPIVAALDGEGARVVSESGAGIAGPAEDVDALSEAVIRMYRASPAERDQMGRSARRYFEANFERLALLIRLEQLLQKHSMEAGG